MTARLRSDMTNIITGVIAPGVPSPPIQSLFQTFTDLIDSSYFSTDTVVSASPVVGTPLQVAFAVPVACDVNIPDAAGDNTYQIIIPFKCTIIGVEVNKVAAGAGNTIKLTTAADVDITNAIAADTLNAITRVGTIDPAQRDIAAGSIVKIIAHRAAGTMTCKVRIWVLKTP